MSNSNDYFVGIVSTSPKWIGLGAAGVSTVPGGTSSDQDIGDNNRRWRSGFFNSSINFNLLSTTIPADYLANGSMWMVDASVTNSSLSALKVQIGSSVYRIIDQNNKTNMTGALASWSVPSGSAFYWSATNLLYETGGFSYFVHGGSSVFAATAADLYAYGNVQLIAGKKMVFDWDQSGNSYIVFAATSGPFGSGQFEFWIDGTKQGTLSNAGWTHP